ncbi:hypothetical protein GCM10008018_13320 [Paenibacillus marchantiophytorum]|uniref:DUF3955 domain-containing protein n=1 Tax=Paenibacillus marchantiophytorum TaxID=1619310 RepID=A0ABQ2BTZ8_9BACL|nr:DUF3955 domain-containing protein [Paenibacillus marchantiophytorum]GGI45670.1 hypothetical protein GCM10008018_13320 [Paenibacillus marchantiophytorum]
MKKKYLLASSPMVLGVICMISYFMIGSKAEPDGTLVEHFFLVPLSYLLVFSSILIFLAMAIRSILKRKK